MFDDVKLMAKKNFWSIMLSILFIALFLFAWDQKQDVVHEINGLQTELVKLDSTDAVQHTVIGGEISLKSEDLTLWGYFTAMAAAIGAFCLIPVLANFGQWAHMRINWNEIAERTFESLSMIRTWVWIAFGCVVTALIGWLWRGSLLLILIFAVAYNAHSRDLSPVYTKMVAKFEGCNSRIGVAPGNVRAYRCPAGVPTIGYGTTRGVYMGMVITIERAGELMREDSKRFARHVEAIVPNMPIYEFESLCSFAYNLGSVQGNLRRAVIARNTPAVQYWMNKYVRGGGKVLRGLVKRRQVESEWYAGRYNDLYS